MSASAAIPPGDEAGTAITRFAELIAREDFRLAAACLSIAQDAYPTLDPRVYLESIQAMAECVRGRLAEDAFAEQRIVALNHHLFGELGFRGDDQTYYDPRNSYLNDVIDRRRGLPITLAILYMEVGRRIGLPLEGVSFPGHFLVKVRVRRGQLVLDPFACGEAQGEAMLRERLARTLGRGAAEIGSIEPWLRAAHPRQIVARVLRNLKALHLRADRAELGLAVLDRLVLVAPEVAEDRRDRGLLYQRLECFRPALADLERYLADRPGAADAGDIRERVVELTRLASRMN